MNNQFYDLSQLETIGHHPAMGELVDLLCHRTGNTNRDFFQAEVAYFLGLIPSAMRARIKSPERGNLPINIYSIALATSGFGKGHSVSILEEVVGTFREKFTNDLFPLIAEESLRQLAVDLSITKNTAEEEEMRALENEFARLGHPPFLFDSGTGPAVKQLRYKLLLAKLGSINFQMDEIGSNLIKETEILNILLELYDLGRLKPKLTKNTNDNERGLDLAGSTPANVLMFGTTSKLFDGSKTEDEFYSFLDTGYARRCFFGLGKPEVFAATVDPKQVYDGLVAKNKSLALERWQTKLGNFAKLSDYNQEIEIPDSVGVELVSYRLLCEYEANLMPEHEVIRKAELSHRYFKAVKLAGVYAFLDRSPEITSNNLAQAILVAEESGKSFQTLLTRERNFVRLAKYVADSDRDLTHADLLQDLPYYPASATPRKEIMDLAMAWGVGNHVVIKRNVVSNVEFFSGSTLQETDLNKLMFSYSDHIAYDYVPETQPFDQLPNLLGADGMHWCNHHFAKGHRTDENIITGFNCLVVDVDGGISLDAVHELLKDFTFITSTTKRHTAEVNRFRLILPTNYILHLDKLDYRAFIDSFLTWLPFESDDAANQRSKKWMTLENSEVFVNKAPALVDVLPFIPKTKQHSEYKKHVADLGNLDNLERWFLEHMETGSRNNNLLKYAMMLNDAGLGYDELSDKVLELNARSPSPLKEDEVQTTILRSVASKSTSEIGD